MTEPNPTNDLKRTIVLIYGMLESGKPFWVFSAVKPSKYGDFIKTYKNGTLDIHKFDGFGEIIVCGEGKVPPQDIILKVAEMYQTDPTTLMNSMKDEAPPAGKK